MKIEGATMLPPGQHARSDFPRFGLSQFAERIPRPSPLQIVIDGDLEPFEIDATVLAGLTRIDQVSDLHCVTTWSATSLRWSGFAFREIYEALIEPRATGPLRHLHAKCADGFRMRLPLEDALGSDVLLADRLDGEPLPLVHGGPCRFVAPAHYGYKNPKHVVQLTLTTDPVPWKTPTPMAFMEHPRARVALEERGTLPGWLLRWVYRPLVASTVRSFEAAWEKR